MLLLVNNPRSACALIDFVNTLKKGGLYVIGHVTIGRIESLNTDPCSKIHSAWLSLVDHLKIKAFIELTVAPSLREGIHQLVRISGIGAMKPNTIVLGFRDEAYPTDDFVSPFSPYSTSIFEGIFPTVRQRPRRTSVFQELEIKNSEASKRMSKEEFVGIIGDILKLRKNVCLSRHFQGLNKATLFEEMHQKNLLFGVGSKGMKKTLYLDVWLIDFFSPWQTNVSDTSSLFILQLACIVNMVPRWKKMQIRVFICAKESSTSSENTK